MSAPAMVADSEIEHRPGLTADKSLRRSARGASRPPWAGFEARHPRCQAPMVIHLVGGCAPESRVRPVAVVPGTVERQLVLERDETVRDHDESPRAFVL